MQTDFDMSSVPGQSSDRESAEGSILKEIGELDRTIAAYGPSASWSTTFRHVPQGTVAVHQLRLLDISRREEVLFLELIEGSGRHVRAPDGQWFFSSEHGHWNAYKGVIPQGTLARCKKFLIQLEGLYALFESSIHGTMKAFCRPPKIRWKDARVAATSFLLPVKKRLFAACHQKEAIGRKPIRPKSVAMPAFIGRW